MATTAVASGGDWTGTWKTNTEEADLLAVSYGPCSDPSGDVNGPAAGFRTLSFVGRYVGDPGHGSGRITLTELQQLNLAGISAYFYYENGSIQSNAAFQAMTNTQAYNQGVTDATNARSYVNSVLGLPSSHPVYFVIDFDSVYASTTQIGNYFLGICSVYGSPANVGIYGSGYSCFMANGYVLGIYGSALGYWCQSKSSGWNGNGYYNNTTNTTCNLWQWPISGGYSPYGNITMINAPSGYIDGVFAFTGNFGQYGGSGGTGQQTYATVTTTTPTFTQPSQQTIIVPKYNYDKVLFSASFSTSITHSTWPVPISGSTYNVPNTNIGQYAYPIGNFTYSLDGGSLQTNDFGEIFAGDFGSSWGNYVPSVLVQPIIDNSGTLYFDVTVVTGYSHTVQLTINIALMAYPNATQLLSANVEQTESYTNFGLGELLTEYSTYRRILLDGNTVGLSNPATIAHNLHAIPNLMVWPQDNSGTIEQQAVCWTDVGQETGRLGVSMDSTNIYIYTDTVNNYTTWYRVYQDN